MARQKLPKCVTIHTDTGVVGSTYIVLDFGARALLMVPDEDEPSTGSAREVPREALLHGLAVGAVREAPIPAPCCA